MLNPTQSEQRALEHERTSMLEQLEDWLEKPMIVLGFIWLALLVLELTRGLSPFLQTCGTIIWIVFLVDFVLKLVIAPRKWAYLRNNWLTLIALVVPALRVFRIVRVLRVFRLARASRGLRLVKVVASTNRGMSALRATLQRRRFGYVVALTVLITIAGAAGMLGLEGDAANGLNHYGNALWWTAMIMTTMGTDWWPQTAEGRLLCFLLAAYAFAVWGYVTATLATFFMGRDTEERGEAAKTDSLDALRREIAGLREEIRKLSAASPGGK